jgi:hypothetical protein
MRCDAWLAEERVLAEVYGVVVTQHLRWRKRSAIGRAENLEWPLSGSARTLAQFLAQFSAGDFVAGPWPVKT